MDTKVKACNRVELCTREKMEKLGAWVYTGMFMDSIFKRFDTIAEAVEEAVKHDNAHVIYDGIDIAYGKLAENVIYYTCINTGESIILNITGDKNG